MSGQQVGTAVGFVAGFFLPGGPQVWASIGGLIGGWVAPTQFEGPKLTDGMSVTAQDGVPNPWGFGTFSVGCNVINAFELREHSDTDDGKGSGQETTTYSYTRSFALGICRANRNEDGTYSDIAGIVRVTHNGKDVYNVLPDALPEQTVNNADFLAKHKFYLGGEAQNPDPTLTSLLAAQGKEASAYRGQVYLVGTDVDQTDARGAMGTWEFVVAMGGNVTTTMAVAIGQILSPTTRGVIARSPDGTSWPTSTDPISPPVSATNICAVGNRFYLWALTGIYYTDGMGGQPVGPVYTMSGVGGQNQSYTRTETIAITDGGNLLVSTSGGAFTPISTGASYLGTLRNTAVNDSIVAVYYQRSLDGSGSCMVAPSNTFGGWMDGATVPMYAYGNHVMTCSDERFAIGGTSANVGGKPSIAISPNPKLYWDNTTLSISAGTMVDRLIPGAPGCWVALIDNGEVWWTADDWTTANLSAQSLPDHTGLTYNGEYFIASEGTTNNGKIWTSPTGSEWTQQTQQLNSISLLAARPPTVDSIDPEKVALSTIISEVCRRSGLEALDIDVSLLDEQFAGFKVAIETTGESIITSIQAAGMFDVAEWDDRLRFVPRGSPPAFELFPDDLAERDGPLIEETEAQEVELLRKVIVRSMDPDAGYVETSQSWERRATTVKATGEQTISLPLVMDRDTQRRTAHKRVKVAWSEPWRYAFNLPYTRAELTPTDVGVLWDRSGRGRTVRLDKMTEDSGLIEVREAPLYRQSAYTSNVVGIPHGGRPTTAPQPPGPTYFWAGNLPSLRTSDNVPGVYIAACGYQAGWHGAAIWLSTDNGESFVRIMEWPTAARMGTLTADIDAADEPISVFMNAGTLSSCTPEQLLNRHNAFAITTAGVSEIGQFQTANLVSGQTYDLTDTVRGGLLTTPASHAVGDPFVMLASVAFVPIDISRAGTTLIFRAVSYGRTLDETDEYPLLFNPLFTSVTVDAYTDDLGEVYTDEQDNTYFYEAIT